MESNTHDDAFIRSLNATADHIFAGRQQPGVLYPSLQAVTSVSLTRVLLALDHCWCCAVRAGDSNQNELVSFVRFVQAIFSCEHSLLCSRSTEMYVGE